LHSRAAQCGGAARVLSPHRARWLPTTPTRFGQPSEPNWRERPPPAPHTDDLAARGRRAGFRRASRRQLVEANAAKSALDRPIPEPITGLGGERSVYRAPLAPSAGLAVHLKFKFCHVGAGRRCQQTSAAWFELAQVAQIIIWGSANAVCEKSAHWPVASPHLGPKFSWRDLHFCSHQPSEASESCLLPSLGPTQRAGRSLAGKLAGRPKCVFTFTLYGFGFAQNKGGGKFIALPLVWAQGGGDLCGLKWANSFGQKAAHSIGRRLTMAAQGR